MAEQFYVVATTADLEAQPQMHIDLNGVEILLCRDKDNYHAISYYCSHAEFSLEGGFISNGCITCPYHGAEFDLADGSVLAAPAFEPIKIYPLKIEAGTIAIALEPEP